MPTRAWSPKVRKVGYVVMSSWALINVGGSAGFLATDIDTPVWWDFQSAAAYALAAYTGLVAAAWVPKNVASQQAMVAAEQTTTSVYSPPDGGADGIPDDTPKRSADPGV